LAKIPPTNVHHHEGQPWTKFSKATVAFLLILSFAGLAVGMNTNAMVLMSSGIPAFETPIRAYLFSTVPILLAAMIKVVGWMIEDQNLRRKYTFAVCTLGIFLGIVWAGSFAKTFPGFTQSAAEIVQSLTTSNGGSSSGSNSGWMVFISLLAEACCAGGCWLVVQVICDRHQKTIVEPNPIYRSREAELQVWCRCRNDYHRLAGQLAGKLNAIADARKHFIENCVGYFYAALKLATKNDGFVKS
jgi:hypothetical protein